MIIGIQTRDQRDIITIEVFKLNYTYIHSLKQFKLYLIYYFFFHL